MNGIAALFASVRVRILIAILAAVAIGAAARAEPALIPHPAIEQVLSPVSRQLGAFGESLVDGFLRARGFEVIDGNLGIHGIDRIAIKRAANGELVDVRFIEVKTRQTGADFKLSMTQNSGPQLSDTWLKERLKRLAAEHPDIQTRNTLRQVLAAMERRPEIIRRELHGVGVAVNRYVILNVDKAGRITGEIAQMRLDTVLKGLAEKADSPAVRKLAAQHLAQFESIRKALAPAGSESAALVQAGREGMRGLARHAGIAANGAASAPETAVIVRGPAAAKEWVKWVARQPGVAAAGLAFAVDGTLGAWEYYRGRITTAEFQRQTAQTAFKSAVGGLATQLVYVLAPTPHGLVVMGVAVVAFIVAEQAVALYDRVFTPSAPPAGELAGIVPEACIRVPMLEDVAAGRAEGGPWDQ